MSLPSGPDAPVFHSALLAAIERGQGAPRTGTAVQWQGWLDGAQRRGEFRKAERDWLGVDAWLAEQPAGIRHEDLGEFVRAHEVHVTDRVLSHDDLVLEAPLTADAINLMQDEDPDFWMADAPTGNMVVSKLHYPERDDAIDFARRYFNSHIRERNREAIAGNPFGPVYDRQTLPGGNHYRELLLTMPTDDSRLVAEGDRISTLRDPTPAEVKAFRLANHVQERVYRSKHFPNVPNLLAHIRFDERVDADRNRVLFLEEIQSDWHQDGRQKGYRTVSPSQELERAYRAALKSFHESEARSENAGIWRQQHPEHVEACRDYECAREEARRRVPDAPFKSTDAWVMLAFKRMVAWAAEQGFDRIAWTTGQQQTDRYNLSKQIDSIDWLKNECGYAVAADKNGNTVIEQSSLSAAALADLLGKELSDHIVSSEETIGKLSGLDLEFGGQGMKAFYDQILPSAVNKWARKFGGAVEVIEVEAGEAGLARVQGVAITPAMREAVLAGLPLFKREPEHAIEPEEDDDRPAFRF